MATAFFLVEPLLPGGLAHARGAIAAAAATAAVSEGGGAASSEAGTASGLHLGLAILAPRTQGGDVRLQVRQVAAASHVAGTGTRVPTLVPAVQNGLAIWAAGKLCLNFGCHACHAWQIS